MSNIEGCILGVESAGDVEVARRQDTTSRYDSIATAMAELDEGQVLVLAVPEGIEVRRFMNRLNSALRRFDIECPAGCRFVRKALEGNKVGIFCQRDKRKKANLTAAAA